MPPICVWCGEPLPPRKRRWCSTECVVKYQQECGYNWALRVFNRNKGPHGYTCARCGYTRAKTEYEFDADHITAICLGGDAFDVNNGQVLCKVCHAKKTADDMAKLAALRAEARRVEYFKHQARLDAYVGGV